MDIKVSGRKTTVTDALRAHVDDKIGEALKVFDIEPMTADVVLRYEKNPSNPNPAIVEVTVRARGSVIRVAEHGADMYAAIDLAADKAMRQLRKFKTRVVDGRQGGPLPMSPRSSPWQTSRTCLFPRMKTTSSSA
jgi:putative sigma-54 modulation protein